jgi:hypothetical protein
MNTDPQLRISDRLPCYENPLETWKRYQAQSILVGEVDKPEVPTLSQAEDILLWSAKARAYEN